MITIAIDGPAGVGKSTVSKALAQHYGLAYLDTGAMYRAAAWWCLHHGVDLGQDADDYAITQAVYEYFMKGHFRIGLRPDDQRVWADDTDITEAIRSQEVSSSVSRVARIPEVRRILIEAQKRTIRGEGNPDSVSHGAGIVAEGRDTTTVVAPKADVRVLLTARPEVRQRRRSKENAQSKAGADNVAARDKADSQVNNFTTAAPGVTTVDNSDITLEQTIDAFERIVEAAYEAKGEVPHGPWPRSSAGAPHAGQAGSGAGTRAGSTPAAAGQDESHKQVPETPDLSENDTDDEAALDSSMLDDYELSEEDRGLLDRAGSDGASAADNSSLGENDAETAISESEETGEASDFPRRRREDGMAGVLAVVGRPNVGKSTFVNRVLGRKAAVVDDRPGVTRDRVSYQTDWNGEDFLLVDTGGWEAGVEGISSAIASQAEIAVSLADAVLLVVDAQTGMTDMDQRIVRLLRRSGKPVTLAVNKIDDSSDDWEAADFWKLGLGTPYPVSSLHGLGVGDVLDACLDMLHKSDHSSPLLATGDYPRVALIGRPNVGKSSLLNQLSKDDRAVVNDEAGTTRDPVDEVVDIDGRRWVVVDTAGLKRKMRKVQGPDYYSSLRTQTAIERADVCLVLFDVSEPIAEQDLRVMTRAVDAGKAIVLVFNKWDLLDDYGHQRIERLYASEFTRVTWARRINLSAKTGWHTNRISEALEEAYRSWHRRIPTSQLNGFLGRIQLAHPHPLRGGKQPRILFATQAGSCPPRFVLFTTGFLDPTYRRYIERQLRENYRFEGTPIQISVRVRERKKRNV